jgi:ATP-dependent Clp protease ATP-binding subunit ClpA
MQMEAQLADRNVTISLSDDAADWLAKNGFDELYGARPLARVIQEHIKKPLADDILFGRLVRGGHVKVESACGQERQDRLRDRKPNSESGAIRASLLLDARNGSPDGPRPL